MATYETNILLKELGNEQVPAFAQQSVNGEDTEEHIHDSNIPCDDERDLPCEQSSSASVLLTGSRDDSAHSDREYLQSPESQESPRKPARASFSDLTTAEFGNIVVFFLLYFSQGIPVGLVGGTVPTLLKPYLTYGKIGLFSMAFYPYSTKLLWSPLVDALWTEKLGRRKSWILPALLLSGSTLIVLGLKTPGLLRQMKENDSEGLALFIGVCLVLIFLSASQGCAVDGWTVSQLPPTSLHWASTAHSLGMICGEFTSYTLFLYLSSPAVADHFRAKPGDDGLISFAGFTIFCGGFYCLLGTYIALVKSEKPYARDRHKGIIWSYKAMLRLLCIRPVQSLVLVHLLARIGFEVNDSATNLKLLDLGFGQTNVATLTLIDLPFDIIFSFVGGVLCVRFFPLQVWTYAFMLRLLAALMAQAMIMLYPGNAFPAWYYFIVVFEHILSTSSTTTMFVSFLTFHFRIADPLVGGTYLTLLATAQNMGGTLPRAAIMKLIEMTTRSSCNFQGSNSNTTLLETLPPHCAVPVDRASCLRQGATCNITIDGYDIINSLCVIVGGFVFACYIRRTVQRLQQLPRSDWLLQNQRST